MECFYCPQKGDLYRLRPSCFQKLRDILDFQGKVCMGPATETGSVASCPADLLGLFADLGGRMGGAMDTKRSFALTGTVRSTKPTCHSLTRHDHKPSGLRPAVYTPSVGPTPPLPRSKACLPALPRCGCGCGGRRAFFMRPVWVDTVPRQTCH